MDQYLMSSKKQTETLEEINVAIKRAFDLLGILPQIEEVYESSDRFWALRITYDYKYKISENYSNLEIS
jgi:hypothetical protein